MLIEMNNYLRLITATFTGRLLPWVLCMYLLEWQGRRRCLIVINS